MVFLAFMLSFEIVVLAKKWHLWQIDLREALHFCWRKNVNFGASARKIQNKFWIFTRFLPKANSYGVLASYNLSEIKERASGSLFNFWWVARGLNSWPLRCKRSALANWASDPLILLYHRSQISASLVEWSLLHNSRISGASRCG